MLDIAAKKLNLRIIGGKVRLLTGLRPSRDFRSPDKKRIILAPGPEERGKVKGMKASEGTIPAWIYDTDGHNRKGTPEDAKKEKVQ